MSIDNLLDKPLSGWMQEDGPEGDIVISSRIRLARNLDNIPFPNRASVEQLTDVVNRLKKSTNELSGLDQHSYMFLEMEKLSALERMVLVEKHIVSPNHITQPHYRGLLVRDDAAISIMVNEEDHLRIQALAAGLNLNQALALANLVDDKLEEKLDYAFGSEMGYLTACPTNIGTGLRASVMMHLPGLVLTNQINRLVNATVQFGFAVRGLYGEGTDAIGNIFQISNQLTLGYDESEIINNLGGVVGQVVEQERAARQAMLKESADRIKDTVWRAYGILRYAHRLSGQEALTLLSQVKLGIDVGIVDTLSPHIFNELIVSTRPNFMQKLVGREELDSISRDKLRAQLVREKLEEAK